MASNRLVVDKTSTVFALIAEAVYDFSGVISHEIQAIVIVFVH